MKSNEVILYRMVNFLNYLTNIQTMLLFFNKLHEVRDKQVKGDFEE